MSLLGEACSVICGVPGMLSVRIFSIAVSAFIAASPHTALAQSVSSSPNAYDGGWRVTGQCSAGTVVEQDGSRLPAHGVGPFTVNVRGGRFEILREGGSADGNPGVPFRNMWRGTIQNHVLSVEVTGSDASGRTWDYQYSGSPTSNTMIAATGVFRGGRAST